MNITEILSTYIQSENQLDHFLDAESSTIRTVSGRILSSPKTAIANDTFVMVSFHKQEVMDKKASEAAGKPVVHTHEMIMTKLPPDADYAWPRISNNRVKPSHIFRFPQEYHSFKIGAQAEDTGTPLAAIGVPADIAERLIAYGYNTVERIAMADLSLASKIPTISTFKAHAEEYLRKKPSAEVEKKLAAQNQEIAELKAMIGALAKKSKKDE